ncbi:magnesium transporter [Candidatus Hecatella orcuttiae]|jgi:magnesium transporter|uniref:magnesium transporter n=1 Tax=Candidatus Hecatella orcuttiae TaxID=1935119 RepID=UPI002868070F|nr:magnesium transporter [Candidatus Hecatella orcuttiae]
MGKEVKKAERKKTLRRLMVTKYVALSQDLTVEEGIGKWRETVHEARIAYNIYVVDSEGRLEGLLTMRELLAASPQTKLKDIMRKNFAYAYVDSSVEQVASVIIKNDLCAVPLLSRNHKLLGIVSADDILDAMRVESDEDIYRLAGILGLEFRFPAAGLEDLSMMVKSRIPWLIICVIIGVLVSGSVIKKYEDAIAALPLIAVFIPVLMDSGGNIGTQSSTIIVRALALGQMRTSRVAAHFLLADLGAGAIIGFILAVFVAALAALLGVYDLMLLFTLSASMFLIPITAIGIGFVIPYLSYIFKVDPAVTSGPLVTLIADVTALLIYFLMVITLYLPRIG